MKPMISSCAALAAICILAAPVSAAQSCADQAADLQKRQAETQKTADARVALVEKVEAAGDAWDDVEIHRRASVGHAKAADEAKVVYETLKADLMQKEMSLQSMLVSLNEDVASYNAACVKE